MEKPKENVDVVLIGAGIMSATLGVLLKELNPQLTIEIYERLNQPAEESSSAWNNAGTGHSAFCELNYTPENPGGTINTKKAILGIYTCSFYIKLPCCITGKSIQMYHQFF